MQGIIYTLAKVRERKGEMGTKKTLPIQEKAGKEKQINKSHYRK